MSTSIAYVENQTRVISAEFVKLRIIEASTSTTYTFSTSYKNETIDGVSYTAMGGLIAISNQQRDLKVTGYDTTLTLAGVDPANIAMVLGKPIRGSEVELYRGFYSADQQLLETVKRFTGIVTSYNVTEERITDLDAFTVSINCSSYKTLLENNIGGRRTNRDEWTKWYGTTDTSMDSVERLNGAYFDFGVPVK